ncbi:hypothetical protein GMLC_28000 [Geomonas limicola]|uniref:Glycosyltransferase subfamily 4-like N-terminal domain-containing protein n=1 Tax=Geomonas limicola TaxID=2740186 RepID=A0A6V8N9K7_9BACT|nr:hypothetical protein GMLC_28000 [Geomonas limicola]
MQLHCVSLEAVEPSSCELDIKCELHHVRLQRPKLLKSFANLWRRLMPYASERKAINQLIDLVTPDVVWLEFGFLGHLIPMIRRKEIPVVMSTHNVESYLYQMEWLKSFSAFQRIVRLPFLALNRFHERYFFRLADKVVAISEKDCMYYRHFIPEGRLSVVPNFRINDFGAVPKLEAPSPYLCIVGSLGAFQNYQGVVYFVQSVWPRLKLRYPELLLYIVGAPPRQDTPQATALRDLATGSPGVIMTGEVDSTIPYVKGAIASVVPIFDGSGTRTKVVESVACGVPVVSTTIGAEGLPFENGQSILIANSVQSFVDSLVALIENPELGESIAARAYKLYEKDLGYEANKARLELLLGVR